MKIKILRSLKEVEYNPDAKKKGKTILMNQLLKMENAHSVGVEVDMRSFIIYAPVEALQGALRYIRKLENRGLISVDRRWANVELEHYFVANRVKTLMWNGELKEATLEIG